MKSCIGCKQVIIPFLLLPILVGMTACEQTAANTRTDSVRVQKAATATPSAIVAAGQDIAGWDGMAWGTTIEQAGRSLSVYNPKPYLKKDSRLIIDGFKIERIECRATLLFDETGLHRVVLRPTSNPDIPDFTFRVLKEGLRDKYGPTSQREIFREVDFRRTVNSWVWERPHGTITLEYAVPQGSRKPVIGLIYAKRTALPEL